MAKKQKILGCGYFVEVKQQTQWPSVIRYRRVEITWYLCKLNMSFLHTSPPPVCAKVPEHWVLPQKSLGFSRSLTFENPSQTQSSAYEKYRTTNAYAGKWKRLEVCYFPLMLVRAKYSKKLKARNTRNIQMLEQGAGRTWPLRTQACKMTPFHSIDRYLSNTHSSQDVWHLCLLYASFPEERKDGGEATDVASCELNRL